DIALQWMITELEDAEPGRISIRHELLQTAPDPNGLQHDERQAVLNAQPACLRSLTFSKLTWSCSERYVYEKAELHQSVMQRFEADAVPHLNETKPYRPKNLRDHRDVAHHYCG